ncbi:hypothetical protein LEL86_22255 [Streptomyces sp. WA6-1-16]|uniref:hypothetical protein n=1 Tax=Streptomyces sp. WA6-1-16 TaxID=2879427 RepID=UPI001CE2C719|nr:hypothetical protein [Streptomyces sp. WA6-1-16]UCA51837.1 hypothetical protein LEL86_22255 [Streptomyces sp. WA6-1-16]
MRPVVDGQLASVDTSGEVTRARMYEFLARRGVRVTPGPPRPLPVPAPEPVRRAQVAAYDVTGAHDAWGTVEIQRRPLVAGHHTGALGFCAVTTGESHPHWPDAAEVLARTVAEAEVAALDRIADAALRHEHLDVLVARLDETRWAPDRGVERPGGLHPADADPVIADVRTGPKSARNLLIVVPR